MLRPIDQQMKDARQVLRTLREHLKPETKAHQGNWRLYLRAFDAREQRVALKDIAAVLWTDVKADKEIGNTLEQAKRLIASGYRSIIPLRGAPRLAKRRPRKL